MPGRAMVLHPIVGERLTLDALAAAADLPAELVNRFVANGLLEPATSDDVVPRFEPSAVRRVCTIQRLRTDLGINLAGVAVVLDLMERIESLHRLVTQLRRGRAEMTHGH